MSKIKVACFFLGHGVYRLRQVEDSCFGVINVGWTKNRNASLVVF